MKVSITLAIIGVIVAEFVSSQKGLGTHHVRQRKVGHHHDDVGDGTVSARWGWRSLRDRGGRRVVVYWGAADEA